MFTISGIYMLNLVYTRAAEKTPPMMWRMQTSDEKMLQQGSESQKSPLPPLVLTGYLRTGGSPRLVMFV